MHPLDGEIQSIVNEYHWSPEIVKNLYCDDLNYEGIVYWYNVIKELQEKIPKK